MAFPLSGTWDEQGRHLRDESKFSLICASGAIGKCVRWGYKPWRTTPEGTSLWDHHQACVRMVRADYGGDGIGYTRDGTPIDYYDQIGIAEPASSGLLNFEAAWDPDGAVCVHKPRLSDKVSALELERLYPRLKGRTGTECREDDLALTALIWNRS
jgi:hypothetical protein